MTTAALKRRILDARDRGDRAELERLQRMFRDSGAAVDRISPSGPRVTPAKATRPRRRPASNRDKVELRDTRSGFRVHLGDYVRRDIEEELQRIRQAVRTTAESESRWRLGPVLEPDTPVEAGGWLFANQLPRMGDTQVTITRAAHGGEVTRHGLAHVAMENPLRSDAFDHEYVLNRWAGDWHSHPLTRDGTPSDRAMQAWKACLDLLGRNAYVGLICFPDPARLEGWNRANIAAWVTRYEKGNRAVCEPARLIE